MGHMQWRRMTLGICPVFLYESANAVLCLRETEVEIQRLALKEVCRDKTLIRTFRRKFPL